MNFYHFKILRPYFAGLVKKVIFNSRAIRYLHHKTVFLLKKIQKRGFLTEKIHKATKNIKMSSKKFLKKFLSDLV